MVTLAAVALASPLHAQEAAAAGAPAARNVVAQWSIITAGFALAIAAAFGALGQARGLARPSKASRGTRAPRARFAAT